MEKIDIGLVITNQIIEKIDKNQNELYNLKSEIRPVISNAIYHRELEVLEKERFRTIFHLSRIFDDDDMCKIVNELDFKLNLQK